MQNCVHLNLALLDLPVQPSNEVMGFGHSSASASQHLPFRFYDQSRRGSCDPAVQRSVFASVDKVPGTLHPHFCFLWRNTVKEEWESWPWINVLMKLCHRPY